MNKEKNYAWRQIPVKETPPTPKWLPIDKDNLPSGNVICKRYNYDEVFSGSIQIIDDAITCIVQNNTFIVKEVTHYIPLTDLLNLPPRFFGKKLQTLKITQNDTRK